MTEVSLKEFPTYAIDAVRTCISHVNQAVELIYEDLQHIDKAIAVHRLVYFSKIRPANYSRPLMYLKEHVALLDTRIDRLLQMMSLNAPLSSSFVVI